ncbi:hypothetical protein SOMG_04049 [Schizosaccharomyces osmophilus]|uniref:Uncharacterized protein n=1 Tax=Schizosaccharomyces osmophilus TaxID=2545709 RepID=A0AAE9WEI0_9SCHI|nr:uncharacterized protein SOMG_04049 [Schizosaccharomyces osmophilus]WBW73776.1 hypothetical protein SOMG_04049 [Schizosaccharomyces osmophilus]
MNGGMINATQVLTNVILFFLGIPRESIHKNDRKELYVETVCFAIQDGGVFAKEAYKEMHKVYDLTQPST